MAGRLLLVPTPNELAFLRDGLASVTSDSDVVAVCGFGLSVSGSRTSQLIAKHQPHQVLLLGIAGGYAQTPIATAIEFDFVGCHGIGAGLESTGDYQSAGEMGWPQFDADGISINDRIDLVAHPVANGGLLSVAAASTTTAQATLRRGSASGWTAEDMEGFSVAVACNLAGVDLRIIRGISNAAGNRDHADWKVGQALQSVIDYLREHPTRNRS